MEAGVRMVWDRGSSGPANFRSGQLYSCTQKYSWACGFASILCVLDQDSIFLFPFDDAWCLNSAQEHRTHDVIDFRRYSTYSILRYCSHTVIIRIQPWMVGVPSWGRGHFALCGIHQHRSPESFSSWHLSDFTYLTANFERFSKASVIVMRFGVFGTATANTAAATTTTTNTDQYKPYWITTRVRERESVHKCMFHLEVVRLIRVLRVFRLGALGRTASAFRNLPTESLTDSLMRLDQVAMRLAYTSCGRSGKGCQH